MAIDGNYKITANTPIGRLESTLIVQTEGDRLTGTCTAMGGSYRLENCIVTGDNVEFTINATTPIGPIKLKFKLLFDGDKVTGTADSPFGPQPVEGKRI